MRKVQLLCALALVLGPAVVSAQDATKGAALLAEARKALGGDSRLAGVKALHVTGTFRRVVGTNDTEGDFEIFLERPDKYLRSEKTGTPGQPSTETIEALVGTDVRDLVRGGGGRGGRDGPIGGGDPDAPSDAAPTPDAGAANDPDRGPAADTGIAREGGRAAAGPGAGGRGGIGANPEAPRRARQADVARLLLMWLAVADVPTPWVGIAESPDGKADVLEARFADGQPTRLFLDSASHVPLMMQWQGVQARAGGPGGRRGTGGRGRGDAGAAPPPPVTFEMTFSDHRAVGGVRLPHVITRGLDGKTIERWAIRNYRVNPSFNADTFTK